MTARGDETLRLRGNQLVALERPGVIWRVERGGVALFCVSPRADGSPGPRRHLFDRGPGDAMFGLPPARGKDRPSVVAVALEETTLRVASSPPIDSTPEGSEQDLRQAAEAWLAAWRTCLGLDGLALQEGSTLEQMLDRPHAELLDALTEDGRRRAEDDRKRFDDRERHTGETVTHALADLTSVLASRPGAEARGTGLFAAASLVARHLGLTLRRPPPRERTPGAAADVEAIARASRVRVRRVLMHDTWWREDCGPVLGFFGKEGRPVALLPRPAGGYHLVDAATRSRAPLDAGMASNLSREAWVFYRPLPELAARGWALARFALHGRSRDLLMIVGAAAAATLLGMFTPQATALLVDHAIPDADLGLLAQIGLGLLAAALGNAVFRWSQGIATLRVETAADTATQSAVWDRLLNLQVAFFRRFSTGDLMSRVTAVSQIRAYLGGTTLRSLFSGVILLLNLALLFYYSPRLTLLALAVAGLTAAVTVLSGVAVLRYVRQVLELKGRFFGLMVQLINGVAKLRVAAAEERAFGRWARDYARLLRIELRQRRVQDAVRVVNLGVSALSAVALFALAAPLVLGAGGGASLSTGVFLAFHVAYGTFVGAVAGLSNTVTDVMAIAILRDRARPILDAPPEITEGRADPGPLAGRLELDRVLFRYDPEGPVILDNVSLMVDPGQFVALVGPSGSGKSTLLRLLLGFESPTSGAVHYDGQDLAGLDVLAVRRQLGVVLQNGRITAGSLFENIVSGTRRTLNEAWDAARAAGFAEEIEAMPMGMHTVISEGGTNLSGGQRQRLLITRALVHHPRVLLLDEATSALDNSTQAVVSESLRRLDVTRVVIAHRLSTVRDAQRIYVIDGGRIVQQGSFAELAGQPGLFARLMARQIG